MLSLSCLLGNCLLWSESASCKYFGVKMTILRVAVNTWAHCLRGLTMSFLLSTQEFTIWIYDWPVHQIIYFSRCLSFAFISMILCSILINFGGGRILVVLKRLFSTFLGFMFTLFVFINWGNDCTDLIIAARSHDNRHRCLTCVLLAFDGFFEKWCEILMNTGSFFDDLTIFSDILRFITLFCLECIKLSIKCLCWHSSCRISELWQVSTHILINDGLIKITNHIFIYILRWWTSSVPLFT